MKNRVEEEHLERRTGKWQKINEPGIVANFPSMTEEELRNITLGVYQLKLAKSYTSEHIDDEGNYSFMVNDDFEGLLRVRLQSRHTSSKSYLLWIEYGSTVTGWYCQCRAGARVLGACAHVSSVLWFLGYARHEGDIKSIKDWSHYLEDAAFIPELVDGSESEESGVEE